MAARTQTSYKDDQGNAIILGKLIAQGGEGEVYSVNGDTSVVAKIYKKDVLKKHNKTAKIKAMCNLYDNTLASFSALPEKPILNSQGKLVGFIMQKITNYKVIHLVYGINDRKKYFPAADWEFLIRVAKNFAIAVDALHNKNIIIGDINQGNILVGKNGMIRLIDCDSYQIEYNGTIFPCEVGVPEYTPPELQGMKYQNITRTKNHDRFGLAIMIFQILMFGRHPYSGKGAPPEIINAIRQGYFCYSKYHKYRTPIYTDLAEELLSDEIKNLFSRAFVDAQQGQNPSRPTAKEWIDALDSLKNSLATCSGGSDCIWCKMAKGKLSFTPFGNNIAKHKYPKHNKTYNTSSQYTVNNSSSNSKPVQSQKSPNPTKVAYKQTARQQRVQQKNNANYRPTSQPTYQYSNTSTKMAWYITGAIIILLLFIIGTVNSNNETTNTNSVTPTYNTKQEQKIYSDTERHQDLRNYKDSFIQVLQHNYKSLLNQDNKIDKNILAEIIFNKDGKVELGNIVSSGMVNPIVKEAILLSLSHDTENKLYFEPLPESYNSDKLKLEFIFTKTGVYYKGEEPKVSSPNTESTVQEKDIRPVKAVTSSKTNDMSSSKPKNDVSSNSQKSNTSIPAKPSQKPMTTPPPKPKLKPIEKSDLEKSTDYFFE